MRRLLVLLPVALAAFAQERLINLHVVALDRNDRPVANLTADDFTIQEQGMAQRIALFRNVDLKGATEAPLGPQEFSNRSGPAPASATVVLFDLLNRMDERLARTQLTKAIANLRPEEPVYFYILIGHGLLTVRGVPAQDQTAAAGPMTAEQFEAAFARAKQLNIDYEGPDLVEMTYQALQSLASRLAGMPGRKSIVWISSGIPTSIESPQPGYSRDYAASENRLTAALQRGNVAIYPVGDSRRQIGSANMGMLTEIADRSGGRAHMDMDVASALKQALDDSRSSYTLGFSPKLWDGKYHKLRVSCTRAGLRLLAPDGYYAAAGDQDEARLIYAAKASPVDAAEIGIRASVGASAKNTLGTRFAIRIQTGDLQLMSSDAGFSGDVSVTLVAYDAAGKASILKQSGYPFRMTAEQHRDALQNGTKVSPDLALNDDVRKVRIIVCDRLSGAVGSLTVPVEHHEQPQHN